MQPRLILNLGPALMPDFMTGALFQSILAWPTAREATTYHRISEELAAGTIRITAAEDPVMVSAVMDQWPQFNWPAIEVRAKRRKSNYGYLEKRLDQRMAAARAGIGLMHEQIFGMPAVLPPGLTDISIDKLCGLIKSDVWIDDPNNIENLVWRPSLPILHLAMATQLLLAARQGTTDRFGIDLQDIGFYREGVRIASLLERVIHDHPKVGITHDRLTLVRWLE